MEKYTCIKDFYIEDGDIDDMDYVLFASAGDEVYLLPDNSTVVNISQVPQQVSYNSKFIVDNQDHFINTKNKAVGLIKEDKVNHPSHYTWLKEKCGIEVIDITRHLGFCIGSAIKYLLRAGYKSEEGYSAEQKEIEDLEKAIWYIKDKIKQLKSLKIPKEKIIKDAR